MEKSLNVILTVDEAAELLRILRSTVYKLAQLVKFSRSMSAGIGAIIVL
jgi:hypothetical protein